MSNRPSTEGALTTRVIIALWLPLAATWLMMAAEGPYVAAIIARSPDAAYNLAAYGVAFAIAWLVESPIMMLLTAANRLVHGRESFLALRRFTRMLNAGVTALMIVVSLPPVFNVLVRGVMALPDEVATLVHAATVILIPWPAAIGYRRFYQGILVRQRMTTRVAYGTVVRLLTIAGTAAAVALLTDLPGSSVGAVALSTGVLVEAVAARWMARHAVAWLRATPEPDGPETLTQQQIVAFYVPLALTSIISTATTPIVTFFAGRGRSPIESLAVLPVIQALMFLFRSGGIAFQEVGVALSGRHREHEPEVRRVAVILGAAASAVLGLVLLTPMARVWFQHVSGLPAELAEFALLPARLLCFLPALEYWLSFQRTRFILSGQTRIITMATATEVAGIAMVLAVCVTFVPLTGAVAASCALLFGRIASNGFLWSVSRRT